MANTKQDLRQIEAKIQDFKHLGALKLTSLDQLFEKVNQGLDFPLKLSENFITPDSKVYLSDSNIQDPDQTNKVVPPVKKQIFPDLSGLWVDFQTQAASNPADFDIEWPVTNTSGFYRYACFTLISSGQIKVLFTEENIALAGLENPGAYFIAGGLPVGYLSLQCTNVAGYFKTSGSTSNIIENSGIYRFGSGAGGGSGTGDANELLERLKNRFDAGTFQYMTPVIFSTDEDTLSDPSTTADYSIVDSNYNFANIGDQFTSIQMLDPEFLGETTEVKDVELVTYWNIDQLDELATYEVSRDGGNEWQTVSMSRIGQSDVLRGIHSFTEESVNSYTQTVGGAPILPASDLTDSNELSRQFTLANASTIKKVSANITVTGSPLGYIYAIAVKDDGGGSPSTLLEDRIGQSNFIDTSALSTGTVDFDIRFTAEEAEDYHIIFATDDSYKNYYTTTAGANKISLDSDGSGIIYTLEGLELDLRVRITSGTANVSLEGFGIFYKDENLITAVDGTIQRHVEQFVGNVDNPYFFDLPFTPDPRLLSIYEINTGQVYRYGAYVLDGSRVLFEPNTFNKPETVILEFIQINGSSFDNSDNNAALLAANHLGSTDSGIDYSVAGRGLFLRRPDGTLREITIDDNDNIQIYSV
jgi:hypothetical protein